MQPVQHAIADGCILLSFILYRLGESHFLLINNGSLPSKDSPIKYLFVQKITFWTRKKYIPLNVRKLLRNFKKKII